MGELLKDKVQGHMATTNISKRGMKTGSGVDFLMKYMNLAEGNPYDAIKNTKGIINMGTAVNRLMEAELQERLRRDDVMRFSSTDHQHYFDFGGTPRLKEALTDFFSRHFTGDRKIPVDQLFVMNGVTSCLDAVAYGCCDAGDVMITPTPVYGRIFTDFQERSCVDVQPLYLKAGTGNDDDFKLTAEALDERIEELTTEGKTVKAFVLVNPHNPLGCVYEEDLVMGLLRVCAKHKVHAIVDEIYALSVHSPDTKFKSVLSFGKLPDPDRTHFLWGISKDFGLAGLRVGVVRTTNPELQRCLSVICTYQGTASIVHEAVATFLMDKDWCDGYFLPTNQQRLRSTYSSAVQTLTREGIRIFEGRAALFVWADLGPYLTEKTEQQEIALFEEFLSAGVYVVPGTMLHCHCVGWFRIVVSVSEQELAVGLERTLTVLRSRKEA